MSKPLEITHIELRKIVNAAFSTFHDTKYLPDDPKEAQAFLIVSGLHSFLISQGVTPQFTVKPVKEDANDITPLDDL